VPGNTVFAKIELIASPSENRFTKVSHILNELKRLALESKPFGIIDYMLSNTPYLAIIQNRPDGKQYLANIKKILSNAIEFESSPFNSVFDYDEYLSGLIALEENESQAPLTTDENSVKIMTIHQSKGLEFTTVYLFAAGGSAFRTKQQSENTLSVNKETGLNFKVLETEDIFYKSKVSLHFKLVDYWRKQVDIEEIKRVLYVAVTRAANNLIVTATVKDEKPSKHSYLDMILAGLNLDQVPEDEINLTIKNMKIAKNEGSKIIEKETDDFELNIKFIDELQSSETTYTSKSKMKAKREFNIHPERIPKHYSDEIITASKFITFIECPFKYYLNYISGVAAITNLEKLIPHDQPSDNKEEYQVEDNVLAIAEGNEASLKRSNSGAITGSIVHEYLSQMHSNELDDQLLKSILDDYYLSNIDITLEKPLLHKQIREKLNKYLSSQQAIEIDGFPDSKNEYEIFLRYQSFYLMGVIDKIIILEDRIIVIDYKTGRNIEQSIQRYATQLDFYAFLCSRIYTEINKFELRLISIDNPEKSITRVVSRDSIAQIEENLNNFVNTLRTTIFNSGFTRNTEHCQKCKFSIHNNECFVP
jgi:ATP-dependent helicase/nuclease subunit A